MEANMKLSSRAMHLTPSEPRRIYDAAQRYRAAVPAIQQAARSILENHRAQECDSHLMPFREIIRLIPS